MRGAIQENRPGKREGFNSILDQSYGDARARGFEATMLHFEVGSAAIPLAKPHPNSRVERYFDSER